MEPQGRTFRVTWTQKNASRGLDANRCSVNKELLQKLRSRLDLCSSKMWEVQYVFGCLSARCTSVLINTDKRTSRQPVTKLIRQAFGEQLDGFSVEVVDTAHDGEKFVPGMRNERRNDSTMDREAKAVFGDACGTAWVLGSNGRGNKRYWYCKERGLVHRTKISESSNTTAVGGSPGAHHGVRGERSIIQPFAGIGRKPPTPVTPHDGTDLVSDDTTTAVVASAPSTVAVIEPALSTGNSKGSGGYGVSEAVSAAAAAAGGSNGELGLAGRDVRASRRVAGQKRSAAAMNTEDVEANTVKELSATGLVSDSDDVEEATEVTSVKSASGSTELDDAHWTCTRAASEGDLHMLKQCRANGCPWDSNTCAAAAGLGHLDVLKWCRANGCPWNAKTSESAAEGGHLEVLKWCRANGCPWDARTCRAAARRGHLELLKWCRANDCPWNEDTCKSAAGGGRLEVLEWCRANGCPWDEDAWIWAHWGGHLEVVQWCKTSGRA